KALITFAKTWWPEPSTVNAVLLANRARRLPALIEEFFATRKVVDNTALNPLYERLAAQEAELRQLVRAAEPKFGGLSYEQVCKDLQRATAACMDPKCEREHTLLEIFQKHARVYDCNLVVTVLPVGASPLNAKLLQMAAQFIRYELLDQVPLQFSNQRLPY